MDRIDNFGLTNEWSILSNFHSAVVTLDGVHYPTVEHAYQAAKTLDPKWREKVRACQYPGQAKRVGRTVPLRPDWEDIKVDVMRELLAQKFTTRNGFGAALLSTGDAELVEGNTWNDRFWGVCNGEGLNMLGILLMARRSELQEETNA